MVYILISINRTIVRSIDCLQLTHLFIQLPFQMCQNVSNIREKGDDINNSIHTYLNCSSQNDSLNLRLIWTILRLSQLHQDFSD